MKETLLYEIDSYENEFGCFGELHANFEDRLDDDPNEGQCEAHMDWFGCYELAAEDMEELGIVADQTE